MATNILVVSDNVVLTNAFCDMVANRNDIQVTYSYSFNNAAFAADRNLKVQAKLQ